MFGLTLEPTVNYLELGSDSSFSPLELDLVASWMEDDISSLALAISAFIDTMF